MVGLVDFLGCTINCDFTNINLNIYKPYLINKMTQGFEKYVKSLMTFNTPSTLHKGILRNK